MRGVSQLQRSRARRWLSARAAEAMSELSWAMTNCQWPGRRPRITRLFSASRDVVLALIFCLFIAKRKSESNELQDPNYIELEAASYETLLSITESMLPLPLRKRGEALEVFENLDSSIELALMAGPEAISSMTSKIYSIVREGTPLVSGEHIGLRHLSEEDLGGIHELFVGYVPRKGKDRVELVNNPKRRGSGTIYTPYDVTQHIVSRAFEGFEGASVNAISRIRILDPAVGSGAFLIQAVRKLADMVIENSADADDSDRILSEALSLSGQARVSAVRSLLISRSVYGADIDASALAICRAALWLMTQPGDISTVQRFNLVKCNSLSPSPGKRLMPSWNSRFPGIDLEAGRFDVVIGNPPYVRTRLKGYITSPTNNLYAAFLELGLSLLSNSGTLSMIVPISLLCSREASPARKILLSQKGSKTLENFDCVPGFLFDQGKIDDNSNTNITQRTTIVTIQRDAKDALSTSRFLRWRRTDERSILFDEISVFPLSEEISNHDRIPKVGSERDLRLISKLISCEPKLSVLVDTEADPQIWVPVAGRYFITASHIDHNRSNSITLGTWDEASFARLHVSINSNLFYWWWRLMSNGFQLEKRDIMEFPSLPISDEDAIRLSGFLVEAAEECLVHKQNAGRPIPNLNYNIRQDILQRIDAVLLCSIDEEPYEDLLKSKSNSLSGDLSQLRGFSA